MDGHVDNLDGLLNKNGLVYFDPEHLLQRGYGLEVIMGSVSYVMIKTNYIPPDDILACVYRRAYDRHWDPRIDPIVYPPSCLRSMLPEQVMNSIRPTRQHSTIQHKQLMNTFLKDAVRRRIQGWESRHDPVGAQASEVVLALTSADNGLANYVDTEQETAIDEAVDHHEDLVELAKANAEGIQDGVMTVVNLANRECTMKPDGTSETRFNPLLQERVSRTDQDTMPSLEIWDSEDEEEEKKKSLALINSMSDKLLAISDEKQAPEFLDVDYRRTTEDTISHFRGSSSSFYSGFVFERSSSRPVILERADQSETSKTDMDPLFQDILSSKGLSFFDMIDPDSKKAVRRSL